jgi:DoxX-like family
MNVAKARTIAGWVLTVLLGALFLFTAALKFTKGKDVVEGFAKLGLADQIPLIASGEAISAILFLVPITHPLGVLLLSSYMGGAILAHMSHNEPYVGPAVILVLIWTAGFLRRPCLLLDPPKVTSVGLESKP